MKKTILLVFILAFCISTNVAEADFTFGNSTTLGPVVNSSSEDFNASISVDGLSLYFISNRAGGNGGRDIWVTKRATIDDPWETPVNLGPTINTSAGEWGVSISSDGLSLFFDTSQNKSAAINDLWVATRATTDDDWGNPVSLGPTVNSSADDYTPSISSDGLSLYFTSGPARGGHGNYDLWVTTRETTEDPWSVAVNLGPRVNSSAFELDPGISADGRVLFFVRTDSQLITDIWMATRATTNDAWDNPVKLGPPINSSGFEGYPNVSSDGSTLFFRYSQSALRSGGDIWQASIIPIVDFNTDGIVDAADMCIMVDYWGTDNSLCDIGPMPWGDGIVDVEDLKILAKYVSEELSDPTLIAHWPLDETEGIIVAESVGGNNAYALGGPIWQPDGGQVGGAIELDGVDDFISAPAPFYPADGPFSLLLWVKGGAAGQAIISEAGGPDWLSIDLLTGSLMTDLKSNERGAGPLLSQGVITDGNWHRIGLVWDGSYRTLYIDDIAVAEDTQINLAGSASGLYIGCGDPIQGETFFSGMIDDIRIYNRAVKP